VLKEYVYHFLTAGIVVTDLTKRRALMMTNAFLFIETIIFIIFSYVNPIFFNSPIIGLLDGISAIASFIALIDLQRNKKIDRSIFVGTATLFFFFISYAISNQNHDFGLIWTIFFPIFVITLMGHKRGGIVVSLFYLILFTLAYIGIGIWDNRTWNLHSFIRFSLASSVLTYVVYLYEGTLYRSNMELAFTREKEAKYLEELHRLSATDSLTELYNRRRMNELLQEHIDQSNRYNTPFSLILFDIDDFKLINDHHGHNIGDQVLIIISDIAKHVLRKTDHISRWGGEEFLILLPNTLSEEAAAIAEKLRQTVEDTDYPHNTKVTCSFGIVQSCHNTDIEIIVDRADSALYKAKKSGKNCICINSYENE
jgi:diguanylate cyclase (GGDEF)-like protein